MDTNLKLEVEALVVALKVSAISRETEQGLQAYDWTLNELNNSSEAISVRTVLKKLNGHLTGIEAHGYFTDEEYTVVEELRALEAAYC